MTEPLTLKYRPQRFGDMVGQKLNSVVLQQMVKAGSVPDAILFDGPRGTGKTSAARILAMELNPNERESILAGTSLSVIEIDAASHGSVNDVRGLAEQLGYSVGAEKRVVILDEAHSITREGFNALLKILEEPPAGVVFVLVTTEPSKIPETVLSRVMEFEFRRVAPEDILARLVHIAEAESIELPRDLIERISEDADGSVRDAVKNLDFVHRAEVTTVDQYLELTGRKDYGPLLLASMLSNDPAKIFSALDRVLLDTGDPRVVTTALTDVIRDVFILKAGGEVTASGVALYHRVQLAKRIHAPGLYLAVQVLWDLKTRVRWNEDQRAALSVALILAADKLGGDRVNETVTPDVPSTSEVASDQDAPRALSLSELQQS